MTHGLRKCAMPTGFHLVSSPFLFAQNVVVTAGLACALRRVADNGTACAVACAAILTKEVAEIFVEAGTGAASDGAAALVGALLVAAWLGRSCPAGGAKMPARTSRAAGSRAARRGARVGPPDELLRG